LRKIITAFIVIFIFVSIIDAQTRFSINYTTGNGLIQNTIRAFIQDSRNRLWIGTAEGVSIYDGTGFSNYPPINSLKNPVIDCFFKVGKDTILAGTEGGGIVIFSLVQYEPDSVSGYICGKKYLINNYVDDIMKDSFGHIWICTDSGVTKWKNINVFRERNPKPGDVEHFTSKQGLPGLSIINAVEGKDGSIWFGTSKGLSKYSNGKIIHYTSENGFPEIPINTLFIDNTGILWICTREGIYKYQNKKFTPFSFNYAGNFPQVENIIQDKNNAFWIGTNNGLFYYKNSKIKKFYLGKEYGANLIINLLEDKEGNIWAGTIHGAFKLQSTNFTLLPKTSDLNYIYKIFPDNNGNLDVLSTEGLYKIKNDRLIPLTIFNKISTKNIRAVVLENNKPIWVGTNKGLFKINNKKTKEYSTKNGLKSNSIVSLTMIDKNILLVGTDNGLSVIANKKNVNNHKFNLMKELCSKLPKGPARSVLIDNKNNIWLGFLYSGLYEIKNDSIKKISGRRNFQAGNIRGLYEDSKGNIWAATRYNGVFELSNNLWKQYTAKNGLGSDWVSTITEDKKNRIWFGTARGVVRLAGTKWRAYDASDGAVSGEITASAMDTSGNLWFGSYNGIYKYENKKISDPLMPYVYIKQIEVNGSRSIVFNPGKTKMLSYNQNTIAFEFAGVWLKNETKVYYKYKLNGFDKHWSRSLNSNYIRFHNLPAGKYNFEVIARAPDGFWNSGPAEVSFVIGLPFWKEWWFILLSVILISSIIFMIYNYKIKRILELERLKTKIASDLHDDVGITLSRISLISELIKENIEPEKIKENLNDIGLLCKDALSTMSDIVWSIDSRNDNIDSLINRIHDSCSSSLPSAEITYSINIEGLDRKKTIRSEIRKNVYLIAREALNNIIKHSSASNVNIEMINTDNIFIMTIADNGKWGKSNNKLTGHGIRNMKTRAEEIGGSVEINKNGGTKIKFTMHNI
jgi:ligand-binding sensor domain-containing protein/two-component sensor histidine kinase